MPMSRRLSFALLFLFLGIVAPDRRVQSQLVEAQNAWEMGTAVLPIKPLEDIRFFVKNADGIEQKISFHNPFRLVVRRDQGDGLLWLGDPKRAAWALKKEFVLTASGTKLWDERLQTNAKDHWASLMKARLLVREGKTADALALLNQAVARDAKNPLPYELRGQFLLETGKARWRHC